VIVVLYDFFNCCHFIYLFVEGSAFNGVFATGCILGCVIDPLPEAFELETFTGCTFFNVQSPFSHDTGFPEASN
jgi:hypothetical protein